MNISIFKRLTVVYSIMGYIFGSWITPILLLPVISILRFVTFLFMIVDKIFYLSLSKISINSPIIIVGNPRSGTTFIQRFLVTNKFGQGSELWQMIYPSIILQKLLKPILPVLELISPAKHHSTAAHKTSLSSVETDDVGILFRFFDGFFLYGFFLSWSKKNLFNWVDPKFRDNSTRDYNWLESVWKRILISSKQDRIIAKLFSVSANCPKFQERYPDSKLLYMVRNPIDVIPSGLSLVTGVLDKKFGFWDKPKIDRDRFISNLYKGLVQLLLRFEEDWTNGKINKNNVMIVKFDSMMSDFETLMKEIIIFTNHKSSRSLESVIKNTSDEQKKYKSKHKYDLSKFGLTKEKIEKDCLKYYETFIN